MEQFKTVFEEYKAAADKTNKIEEAWEKDPCNEVYESEFDQAYIKECAAHTALVDYIWKLTNGQIDRKTIRIMTVKCQDELESIVERIA